MSFRRNAALDTDVTIRVEGATEGAQQVASLNDALTKTSEAGRAAGAGLSETERRAKEMKSAMDALEGRGGGYPGGGGGVGGVRRAWQDFRKDLDEGFGSLRNLGRGIGAVSQALGVFGLAVDGVSTAIEIGKKGLELYEWAAGGLESQIHTLRKELNLLGTTFADAMSEAERRANAAAAAASRISLAQASAIEARATELGTIPELLSPAERAAAAARATGRTLRGAGGANLRAASALSGGMSSFVLTEDDATKKRRRGGGGSAAPVDDFAYRSDVFDDYLGMKSTAERIAEGVRLRVAMRMQAAQEAADYEAQFRLPSERDDEDMLGIGGSVDAIGSAVDRMSPMMQAISTQMMGMADVAGTAGGMVVDAMSSMSQAVGTALTNLIVTGKAGEKSFMRVAGAVAAQTSAQAFSYATLLGAMAGAAAIIGIPIFGATAGQLGAGAGIMGGAGALLAGVARALGAQGIGFSGRGAAGGAGGGGISDAAPARRDPGLLGGPSVVTHNYHFGGAIVGADADRMVAQAAARGTVVSGPSRGGLRLQMATA